MHAGRRWTGTEQRDQELNSAHMRKARMRKQRTSTRRISPPANTWSMAVYACLLVKPQTPSNKDASRAQQHQSPSRHKHTPFSLNLLFHIASLSASAPSCRASCVILASVASSCREASTCRLLLLLRGCWWAGGTCMPAGLLLLLLPSPPPLVKLRCRVLYCLQGQRNPQRQRGGAGMLDVVSQHFLLQGQERASGLAVHQGVAGASCNHLRQQPPDQ